MSGLKIIKNKFYRGKKSKFNTENNINKCKIILRY